MKIDYMNHFYIQDNSTSRPAFSGLQIDWETHHPTGGQIRGTFIVQGQKFVEFEKERERGKSVRALAEEIIREMLEVDKVEMDAFKLDAIDRRLESQDKNVRVIQETATDIAVLISEA